MRCSSGAPSSSSRAGNFATPKARTRPSSLSGTRSDYYELALYKLGWTLYKQEFYDEALHKYIALLDHKVSIGYDFDAKHEEGDERRIADTFRVISLSFSNLGGPEVVERVLRRQRQANYEDRIYSNLGEFYLTKLRYHDAAGAYKAFIGLYPFHRTSPHFSMRVVEIYTKGGFQKLVLDSKKEFARTYGLQAEYWRHFSVDESPEVLELPEEQPQGPRESLSRAVSAGGSGRGEAGELSRGLAVVSRVPGFVPEGRGVAADQLPAGRLAAGREELRRSGARVRAHGLRLSAAREGRGGRLRRDLRAS